MPNLSSLWLDVSHKMLRLEGYKSRYAPTSLGNLHYLEAEGQGKLPPMVFLHGLSAHASELASVYRLLRRRTQKVIAVDLPVHGLSDSPSEGITSPLMNQMFSEGMNHILAKEPPVIIFGNSLGGMAAIRYTNHSPDNIALVILSSPGGANIPAEELKGLFQTFRSETQSDPIQFVQRLYNDPPFYKHVAAQIVKERFSHPRLVALLEEFGTDKLLTPEDLHKITVPTLLIWGQQDRLLGDQVEFYRKHLPPNFKLDEPAHFSHCPYLETPLELANKIFHFALRHLH